jgi:hypothetical protein
MLCRGIRKSKIIDSWLTTGRPKTLRERPVSAGPLTAAQMRPLCIAAATRELRNLTNNVGCLTQPQDNDCSYNRQNKTRGMEGRAFRRF